MRNSVHRHIRASPVVVQQALNTTDRGKGTLSKCQWSTRKTEKQINLLTSLFHRYFHATRLISSMLTALIESSIFFGVKRRLLVTTRRPVSYAIAEMPSRLSNSVALSWLFAHSTSASVGAVLIRIHSQSVGCSRSSKLTKFSETK